MPNIPQYQSQVQMNAAPSFRMQPVAPEAAFGGGVGQAISNMGEEAHKQALKQQSLNDALTVSKGIEDFTTAASEAFSGEGGFLTLSGDNAANVSNDAKSYLEKTRDKISETMNPRQQQLFMERVMPTALAYTETAIKHQQQQKDVSFENGINANLVMAGQRVLTNITNPDLVKNDFNSIDNNVLIFGAKKGWSQDKIITEQQAKRTAAFKSAIGYLLDNNDIDAAKNALETHKGLVNPAELGAFEGLIKKRVEKINDLNTVQNIVNGSGTLSEALQKVDNMQFPHKQANTGLNSLTFEQAANIVSGNESGGNYDAVNQSGSGAKGKYQFMPDTWKGLMGNAPMTPENQEIAFAKMHKETFNNYGLTGILVANYAGTQNAERFAKGLPLIDDNGNEYSADTPQYYNGKEYPSVRQYVENGIAEAQKAYGNYQTEDTSVADAERREKYKEEVKQAWSTKEAIHNQQIKAQMDNFDNWLIQNKPTTIAEIQTAAQQFGFQGADLMNAIGKGKQLAGLMKVEQNQAEQDNYEAALSDIYSGNINSRQALEAKYGNSINIGKLIQLGNYLDTTLNKASKIPSELQNRESMLIFNEELKAVNIKSSDVEYGRVMGKVIAQIKDNREKGLETSPEDIRDVVKQQVQKVVIGRTWYGKSKTALTADVPPGWDIKDDGVYTPDGEKITRYDNGKFYITRNGQELEVIE